MDSFQKICDAKSVFEQILDVHSVLLVMRLCVCQIAVIAPGV